MQSGLTVENDLFEGLELRGFKVYRDKVLDERFKVDGVVIAPPGAWEGRFFPPPIAVQVTTRRDQWNKCINFMRSANVVADRLAYVELALDGELTEAVMHEVATALILLFRDTRTPKIALIRMANDRFEILDLRETLTAYYQWLGTPIAGEIAGKIVYWNRQGRYGFATATVAGPTGQAQELPFFLHLNQVSDERLRTCLAKVDGDLNDAKPIPVLFEDGGREEDRDRKSARRLRLYSVE